jgi:hypothetical protein
MMFSVLKERLVLSYYELFILLFSFLAFVQTVPRLKIDHILYRSVRIQTIKISDNVFHIQVMQQGLPRHATHVFIES